jgi:energy-coupling factor transporter ATP-binding protein EcfA2
MKIRSIEVTDVPPIKRFEANNLSEVVVLAGPNGVGKTRLIVALLNFIQNLKPQNNIRLEIEATCPEESQKWKKDLLNTADPEDIALWQETLNFGKQRRDWRSSVVYIESNRTMRTVSPSSLGYDMPDPWTEVVGGNAALATLTQRFEETQNSIFRKLHWRRDVIGKKGIELIKEGKEDMKLADFPDPLKPFKNAFRQLLPSKELLDPNLKDPGLQYRYEGQTFNIASLSSGEKEVLIIVFDFILRNYDDCIIVIDEPELHLHPELSYRLVRTLKTTGSRNQFVLCTHSPDIISSSLNDSVIFLAPSTGNETNQAIPIRDDNETSQALKALGQSIGIISLAKKIVLIEGEEASLDKQVYSDILRDRYPSCVLVPCGGKTFLSSFADFQSKVLTKTLWGVDFFMICDRDAFPSLEALEQVRRASNGRLKVLSRYHLENYFLDENLLAKMFSSIAAPEPWLTSATEIRKRLRRIARSLVSYAAALAVSCEYRILIGNVDLMPKDCHGKSIDPLLQLIEAKCQSEGSRISDALDPLKIKSRTKEFVGSLEESLSKDTDLWKSEIPGKPLFNIFAQQTKFDSSWLKNWYIKEAKNHEPSPFADIEAYFMEFNAYHQDIS